MENPTLPTNWLAALSNARSAPDFQALPSFFCAVLITLPTEKGAISGCTN